MSRTPFGYALKAIRNDEQAAEVVGIRIFPIKLQAMAYGAMAAAVAGGAYIWSFRYIDPRTVFGLDVALIPVAMALLGGSGLLWGPLIGAVLLSVGIQLLIVNLTMLQFTIIGLAILLIGRYMPGGLLRARWMQRVPLLAPLGHEHHERIAATAAAVCPTPPAYCRWSAIAADRSRVLLATRDLTMAFGGNVAVNRVNLEVREGEILGLIGPNGSGKTTLFNCLSKVYEPVGGDIMFAGQSLRGLRRDTVSRLRIGRTYQIPRPFGDLTVLENVAMPLMFRAENRLGRPEALAEAARFAAFAGLGDKLTERADRLTLAAAQGRRIRSRAGLPAAPAAGRRGRVGTDGGRGAALCRPYPRGARHLRHHGDLGRAHHLRADPGGRPAGRARAGIDHRRRRSRRLSCRMNTCCAPISAGRPARSRHDAGGLSSRGRSRPAPRALGRELHASPKASGWPCSAPTAPANRRRSAR